MYLSNPTSSNYKCFQVYLTEDEMSITEDKTAQITEARKTHKDMHLAIQQEATIK